MARRGIWSVAMTVGLMAWVCSGCAHQEGVAAPRVVPAAATTRPALDDGELAKRLYGPSSEWSIGWGNGAAQLVFFPGGRYVLEYHDSGLWGGATGTWRVHDGEVELTSDDSFGLFEPIHVLEARIGGDTKQLVLVPDTRKGIFERYGVVRDACFRNPWSLGAGETAPSGKAEASDTRRVTVRVQDIPERVQILGMLGQPLGSLVTIRGKWVKPEGIVWDSSPRLHVSVINGKEPKQNVELHDMQVRSYWGKNGRGPGAGENWDWLVDLWRGTEPAPSATDGETWELMGCETGSFDESSEDVWQEMGRPLVPSRPYWMWGFATRFEFIAVRKIQ